VEAAQHDAEPLAPRHVAQRPDAAVDGVGGGASVAIDAGRGVVREPDQIADLSKVGYVADRFVR
jgi:hypothetical protein